MRPRLRTFIQDIYKDINYVLNEEGYAAAEYQDLTRKRFIKAWEQLMDGYKVRSFQTQTEPGRLHLGIGRILGE